MDGFNVSTTEGMNQIMPQDIWSPSPTPHVLDPVPFAYRLVLYVFGTPMVFLNFLGNVIFVTLVLKYRRMRSRTSSLAVSWAVLDLLTGFVLIIQMAVVQIHWPVDDNMPLCLSLVVLQILPMVSGFCHTVLLAVDRYVAIKFPLQYLEVLSYRKLRIYLISVWLYSTLLTFIIFAWHEGKTQVDVQCSIFILQRYYNVFITLVHIVPAMCICVALYVRIFVHVWRHEHQVHVTHTITQDQFLQDRTIASVFLTVTIVFMITWLPYILASLVRTGELNITQDLQMALLLCWLLGNSNSATKIFVYYVLHPDIRLSVKEAIHGEKALRRGSAMPSHSHA